MFGLLCVSWLTHKEQRAFLGDVARAAPSRAEIASLPFQALFRSWIVDPLIDGPTGKAAKLAFLQNARLLTAFKDRPNAGRELLFANTSSLQPI
jgi:hypothetical protein